MYLRFIRPEVEHWIPVKNIGEACYHATKNEDLELAYVLDDFGRRTGTIRLSYTPVKGVPTPWITYNHAGRDIPVWCVRKPIKGEQLP